MYAPAPRWSDDGDAAEEIRLAHRLERVAQDLELVLVLAADVDEHVLRLDRVRRDEAALEEPERDAQHDLAVLERAGLGLVRVDDEVVRLRRAAPASGRTPTCGPSGSLRRRGRAGPDVSSSRDDVVRRHGARLAERREAAARVVLVDVGDRAAVGARRRRPPAAQAPRSSSTIPGTSSAPHAQAVAVVDRDDGRPAAAAEALDRARA